jgi:hypothetical protein
MPTAITHEPIFNTPASSTNTAVVRWSGTTGSTLQDCGVLIDGSNNLIIPAQGDLRLSDTTGGQYVALQANGTTTTHTLTFPAAQGSASTVLTNDGAGALTWAAAAAGALTRLGGDTAEATTTSTSIADINTVSSLTIAAASPFDYLVSFRKTAGAASGGGAGLKLNSIILATPVVLGGGTANVCGGTRDNDEAQNSHAVANIAPTVTNHAFMSVTGRYYVMADEAIRQGPVASYGYPLARPTATITDFIVNAITTSSVTVGSDELHIYTRATS